MAKNYSEMSDEELMQEYQSYSQPKTDYSSMSDEELLAEYEKTKAPKEEKGWYSRLSEATAPTAGFRQGSVEDLSKLKNAAATAPEMLSYGVGDMYYGPKEVISGESPELAARAQKAAEIEQKGGIYSSLIRTSPTMAVGGLLRKVATSLPVVGKWLQFNKGEDLANTAKAAVTSGTGAAVQGYTAPTGETDPQTAESVRTSRAINQGIAGTAFPLALGAGAKIATTGAPDWMVGAFGSKGMRTANAEGRVSKEFVNAYSAARGKPVESSAIASEIERGIGTQKKINQKFGTDFQFTTSQAAAEPAVKDMETFYAGNIAKGTKKADNTIPSLQSRQAKNEQEQANLIAQTRQNVTKGEREGLLTQAKTVGEKPLEYVEKTSKAVDFDELEKVVAGKKIGEDAVNIVNKARKDIDTIYNSIDPKRTIPSDADITKEAIKVNFQELNDYGVLSKSEKKLLSDFYEKPTTARDLIELNANLTDLAKRTADDPKLKMASDLVKEIRQATKDDLLNHPIPDISNKAKQANDLFAATERTVYERTGKVNNQVQPSSFEELRGKAASERTSMEDERLVNNFTGTSEDIKDLKRGAAFVKGSDAATQRNVKNYLYSDLRSKLRGNPTPATYDTWLEQNKLKVQEVDGFDKELSNLKKSLVDEEVNISTATRIMGGQDKVKDAVGKAMTSPDEMGRLIKLAQKDPTGGAIKGVRQLFQEHVEEALNTGFTAGGKMATKASPTEYFESLYKNPDTQKAMRMLWGKDGDNFQTASELFERLKVDRAKTAKVLDKDTSIGTAEGVVAAATPVRAMSIRAFSNTISSFSDREFNKVLAKALVDPEYATTILKAYKDPTESNIYKAWEYLNNGAVGAAPAIVSGSEDEANRKTNAKKGEELLKKRDIMNAPVPEAVKPQSQRKSPEELGALSPSAGKKRDFNDVKQVKETIKEYAKAAGVDYKEALTFANAESSLKHYDKDGKVIKGSGTSARGLYQLTDDAVTDARKFLNDKTLDPEKPEDNIKLGLAYYNYAKAEAKKYFKNPSIEHIYAFYHLGPSGARKVFEHASGPNARKIAFAKLLPDAAKANAKLYYNPKSGKSVSVAKALENIKDFVLTKSVKDE